MKILVTGSSGLVGSRFRQLSKFKEFFVAPDYPELDITNSQSTGKIIAEASPDLIIHFAAYTNVGEAENQRNDKSGPCWQINVEGTKNLLSAASRKLRFIHISTDMVFPGSSKDPGPYAENHPVPTDPTKVTWYGWTKRKAEKLVTDELGSRATIVRLIYPVRAKYDQKLDYLRKPLKLFDEGKLYPLFSDQKISIAFIDEVCQALDKIIEQRATGIFHASSRDIGTPYELVSYLLEKARGVKDVVNSASLDEFLKTAASPVRYPKFGGLGVVETEKRLAIKFSTWREIIDELVKQGIVV